MSECRKTCPELFLIKVLSSRCIREACSRYYDEDEKCLSYEGSFKNFMEDERNGQ